jgi:hypothetical protein
VLHFDASGDFVRAVAPGDGGDLVLAGFDEFFYDELADLAACLWKRSCPDHGCGGVSWWNFDLPRLWQRL